jgi:hypothetical protein
MKQCAPDAGCCGFVWQATNRISPCIAGRCAQDPTLARGCGMSHWANLAAVASVAVTVVVPATEVACIK